jgi:hypothetical protein
MKINIMIAFAALLTLSALNAAEPVDPARFEKEILVLFLLFLLAFNLVLLALYLL